MPGTVLREHPVFNHHHHPRMHARAGGILQRPAASRSPCCLRAGRTRHRLTASRRADPTSKVGNWPRLPGTVAPGWRSPPGVSRAWSTTSCSGTSFPRHAPPQPTGPPLTCAPRWPQLAANDEAAHCRCRYRRAEPRARSIVQAQRGAPQDDQNGSLGGMGAEEHLAAPGQQPGDPAALTARLFRNMVGALELLAGAAGRHLRAAGRRGGARGPEGLRQLAQLLLIVLVLGAGTDYGLFLVFRVRENLRGGADPEGRGGSKRSRGSVRPSRSPPSPSSPPYLSLLVATFQIYRTPGPAEPGRSDRKGSFPPGPPAPPRQRPPGRGASTGSTTVRLSPTTTSCQTSEAGTTTGQ